MNKKHLSTLRTGILVFMFALNAAQAQPITGKITFGGNVTPYVSADGTGALSAQYSQTHSLVFHSCVVNGLSTGSFAKITNGTPVAMYGPLVINPSVAPAGALWTAGNISFYATSISTIQVGLTSLQLKGIGVFSDGTPANSTLGSWTAFFMTTLYNASSSVSDPAPSLTITNDGSNAIISWPTNSIALSFSVQTITNAAAPSDWVTLTNVPVQVGHQMVVTNPISGAGQLFRLIH